MAGKGRPAIDITGQGFGAVTVLERAGSDKHGQAMWLCRCDCGREFRTTGHDLRRGHTKSCGFQHGQYGSPTYITWKSMLGRCRYSTNASYANYGGRGITVCERWQSFENFLADMGERPDGMTLDRLDVDGNYEPGNCRWATPREQALNRRVAENPGAYR